MPQYEVRVNTLSVQMPQHRHHRTLRAADKRRAGQVKHLASKTGSGFIQPFGPKSVNMQGVPAVLTLSTLNSTLGVSSSFGITALRRDLTISPASGPSGP